ncbi:hypothetical protein NIES2104_65350 [Leptolyngbya sp. NIES-2104]|nr:hypothetical protein NIES2104_65350 [Leptolyngbya sp. NIES-2104]
MNQKFDKFLCEDYEEHDLEKSSNRRSLVLQNTPKMLGERMYRLFQRTYQNF